MSNSLAIATVTGALATRVQGLINGAGLTGFDVTAGHPRSDPDSGVYITLVHLAPNAAMRNLDLPTRGPTGEASRRPVLALNLRYLFSFVGDVGRFEAERLAGLVTADLHARPLIGPDEITTFLGTLSASHYLRASDLARQMEPIRLSPVAMDSEELSRVWGLFNQSFYALSMAWEATVVLLDGQVEPAAALPVLTTGLAVVPATQPSITRVRDETLRQPIVRATDTLIIEGSGLLGQVTRVFIGAGNREVTRADLVDGALQIPMPTITGLLPGVHPVVIEHRVAVPGASGDGLRPAGLSNALPLLVQPTLGAISSSATTPDHRDVRVAVTPLPAAAQSAEVTLEETTTSARRSSRASRIDGTDVVFDVTGLTAGTWLVRVTVDGAASVPTTTGNVFTGPTLVVP
ncbi:MAG: DUF4255 domain-containing protein [Polyangiaceae bacterium]